MVSYCTTKPPATASACPVTKEAASEPSQMTAAATGTPPENTFFPLSGLSVSYVLPVAEPLEAVQ